MKTHKFQPYFTGSPLVRVEFIYDDTTMFCRLCNDLTSAQITLAQLSKLNSLHPSQQMRAAAIFADC